MEKLINQDFINFILSLSLLMIANAISGIAKAWKSGTFDWKTLVKGLVGYLLWAVSAAFTVAGSTLYGGNLQLTIGDSTFTFLDAIEYAKKAVYIYWAAKAVQNFIEYGNIDKEVKPVDPQTTFNEDLFLDEEEEIG